MDLIRYIKIGLRWWWLILLSVALSATASYFYSQQLPKIYAARVTLLVGSSVTETRNPDRGNLEISRTLAEVYGDLAHRAPITGAVIERLGLELTPDELSWMIETSVIPQAQLLEIFVLDVHPQRAQILANTIAEELILQSPTGSGEQQEREKFIRAQLDELQTKIENINLKILELEDSMSNLTSAVEIAEAQSQLSGLEQLKRDYQNNYTQFLSSLSESSPNRLTIFEPASEPTFPVSPNIQTNVLLAVAAGLALAISAVVLLEFFNDTLVWQREEPQIISDLDVLGVVGKVANSTNKLVAYDETWSPEADTLRNLRSSIFLATGDQNLSTLLVTSSAPGEGKTFVSANLAVTIAAPTSNIANVISAPGTKVVLVDADLRKPSLHEIFDLPNLLGLADVLAMPENAIKTVLNKALRVTDIDNLSLLPAGRTPLDPASLLSSPRFLKVLHYLSQQADLVIIDSAPILETVETRAIARAVDKVVLVVSHGQTRLKSARKVRDYFRSLQDHNNLLGVIFNRVKLSASYSYYSAYAHRPQPGQLTEPRPQPSLLRSISPFNRSQKGETSRLTLEEVAGHLGVSEDTAQRWCEQGRIPAAKAGRYWLVELEDLNQFIAAYQHDGADRSQKLLATTAVKNGGDTHAVSSP